MNIEHISVSRKSIFDECQAKYLYKYHLKVPSPVEEPIYFIYGKLIHKIAEEYVDRGDPTQFAEIVKDVMNGTIEIEPGKTAPTLDKEYSKKFVNHLKTLKDFIDKIGHGYPGHTEYGFKYDLMPPREFNVTGFIDRIIVKGDHYFICDYKTTKKGPWLKNNITVLSDLQLRIYAKVVQKEFGASPENIHCCLMYLDSGNIVGATYNQQSLDEAERELLEAYIQIHEMDPEDVRGNVGQHCRRCDFRSVCKWWSLV